MSSSDSFQMASHTVSVFFFGIILNKPNYLPFHEVLFNFSD